MNPAGDDHHQDFVDDLDFGLEAAPEVTEPVVRGLLAGLGGAAGWVLGDDDVEDHWRLTDTELDDLTPPLTRIVNRRPRLRRAIERGDEITVAIAFAGFLGRNVTAGRAAKEARDENLDGEAGRAASDAGPGDRGPVEGQLDGTGGSGGGSALGVHPPTA